MSPARTDDLDCRSSFINGDLTAENAENAEEDDLDCRSSFINGTINLWTPQTRGCSFLAEKAARAAFGARWPSSAILIMGASTDAG